MSNEISLRNDIERISKSYRAWGTDCHAESVADELDDALHTYDKASAASEVTDEEMGRAWALYCEENLHDDFSPESMRRILIALKAKANTRTTQYPISEARRMPQDAFFLDPVA
jgi:hypothetical protein